MGNQNGWEIFVEKNLIIEMSLTENCLIVRIIIISSTLRFDLWNSNLF